MIHAFGFSLSVLQVLLAVAGIGILVFVHELGHFLVAKWFRIRVEQFAFGFGPELAGFTWGDTRYSLNAIPLGGMVKMPGESPEKATGASDEFLSQPWYRRFLIAASGPLMNYLFAVVLFAVVAVGWGVPRPTDDPVVADVLAGSPAAAAGLKAGDTIVRVGATPVRSWTDMTALVRGSAGVPIELRFLRAGKESRVRLVPVKDPATGAGLIGIARRTTLERVGVLEGARLGARMAVYQSVFTLKYLGLTVVRWEKPEVAGPIGVVQVLTDAARAGWDTLLHLVGVVSVALGLFNLLPIPLVDGGHMTLALIEAVRRRRVGPRAIAIANYAGLSLIVALFLFATYSDILRLGAK